MNYDPLTGTRLLIQGCPEFPRHEARAMVYDSFNENRPYRIPVPRGLQMALRYERAVGAQTEDYYLHALNP